MFLRELPKGPRTDTGQIVGTNTITFHEDEPTPEGIGLVKSLHIAVECKGMIVSRVLIDNESPLNVCPVMALHRLDIDDSLILPNRMMVWAFDRTKMLASGEIA